MFPFARVPFRVHISDPQPFAKWLLKKWNPQIVALVYGGKTETSDLPQRFHLENHTQRWTLKPKGSHGTELCVLFALRLEDHLDASQNGNRPIGLLSVSLLAS